MSIRLQSSSPLLRVQAVRLSVNQNGQTLQCLWCRSVYACQVMLRTLIVLDRARAMRIAWADMLSKCKPDSIRAYQGPPQRRVAYIKETGDGTWLVHIPHTHIGLGERTFRYTASDQPSLVKGECSPNTDDPADAMRAENRVYFNDTGEIMP